MPTQAPEPVLSTEGHITHTCLFVPIQPSDSLSLDRLRSDVTSTQVYREFRAICETVDYLWHSAYADGQRLASSINTTPKHLSSLIPRHCITSTTERFTVYCNWKIEIFYFGEGIAIIRSTGLPRSLARYARDTCPSKLQMNSLYMVLLS